VSAGLTLLDRSVDLTTRAVVVAVVPTPRFGREAEVVAGVYAAASAAADVVEVPAEPRLLGPAAAKAEVPLAARVETADAARAAWSAGARLLLVPAAAIDEVVAGQGPADEWQLAAMVQTAKQGRDAVQAHPDRLVGLDVTGLSGADAVSEESLALAVGVRLIRTADLRRSRRVVELMAHLLEARR
jgi:hypothetical protein